MFDQPGRPSLRLRRALRLCAPVFAVALYHLEQPLPGADRPRPRLNEMFVSQYSHGSSSGIDVTTTISLLNLSTTTSTVSIATFRESGSTAPLLRDPDSNQATPFLGATVPPSGTAMVRSQNENPGQLDAGYALIFSPNAMVVPQIEFSIFNSGNLAARAQVPARPPIDKGSFTVGQDGRTGVAILNPFGVVAELLIGSVDGSGKMIDYTGRTLPPGVRLSLFLDQLMDVDGATSAEFRASTPIVILPLQQDGLVLTTQDLFPARNVESLFRAN